MPDTFSNPYATGAYVSPIGQSLANLGQSLLTGPTQAQRISMAEQALKLQTERQGTAALADIFGQYGTQGFDRNAAMKSAILGGVDSTKLADMDLYGAANKYGATSPQAANAGVGAKVGYGSTGQGFLTDQARQTAENNARIAGTMAVENAKPIQILGADGNPSLTTQGAATAAHAAPILDDTHFKGMKLAQNWGNLTHGEQAVGMGVAPLTPPEVSNYINPADGTSMRSADGAHDITTGAPIPSNYIKSSLISPTMAGLGLAPNNFGDLQAQNIEGQKATALFNQMIDTITKDPSIIGVTGAVKGGVQDATILADNVARGLGYTGLSDAVARARDMAQKAGVSEDVLTKNYDPNVSGMKSLYGVAAAQLAKANAGGGRASNFEFEQAMHQLGSPESFWASPQSAISHLTAMRDNVVRNMAINEGYMRPGRTAGGGTPNQGPPQATPAPAATPAAAPPAAGAYKSGSPLPNAAIAKLQAHPDQAADFDKLFGAGAAASVLGR